MSLKPNWTQITSTNTIASSMGPFNYYELMGSDTGSFSPGNSTITRKFLILWDSIGQFMLDLLGYGYLQSQSSGGLNYYTISRSANGELPDFHPRYTEFYATEASYEPLDRDKITYETVTVNAVNYFPIKYQCAVITATYRALDYNIENDSNIGTQLITAITDVQTGAFTTITPPNELNRMVTRTYHPQPEFLTINGFMYFARTGRAIAAPPGFVVGAVQKTIVWHDVPSIFNSDPQNPISFRPPNLTAIQLCQGKINSAQFDGDSAGTVLFLGAETKMLTPKVSPPALVSPYTWEISLMFLVKNFGYSGTFTEFMGHNYVYDVLNGRWDKVTNNQQFLSSGVGNTIYQSTDLNQLFLIY